MNSQNSINSSFITSVTNVSRMGPLPPRCEYPRYHCSRFCAGNRCNSNFSVPPGGYPRYNTRVVESNRRVPFRAFLKFRNSGTPSVSLGFSNRCRKGTRECARRLFNGARMFGTNAVTSITSGATCNCILGCLRRQGVHTGGTRVSHLTHNYAKIGHAANRRPNKVMIIPGRCSVCSFAPIRCPTSSARDSVRAARFSFHSVRSAVLGLSRLNRSIPALSGRLRSVANVGMASVSVYSPRVVGLYASPRPLNIAPRSVD